MTTDEQKIEKILLALDLFARDALGIYEAAEKILESLKQFDQPTHDPLEVNIMKYEDILKPNSYVFSIATVEKSKFHTEQEAIDFCVKHGLSIKK